jgi:hypothetical protein
VLVVADDEFEDPAFEISARFGKYFRQPSLRRKHGRAGKRRIRELFAREKVSASLTKVYLSVN